YSSLYRLLQQVLRNDHLFEQLETDLGADGQHGGGNSALQDQLVIVQGQAGDDRLAEATSADERSQRGGVDVDHGRRLDAAQNRGRRQRQLNVAEPLPGRQADADGHLLQNRVDGKQRRRRVPQDRQQRIQEQGRDGRLAADIKQRNHESE